MPFLLLLLWEAERNERAPTFQSKVEGPPSVVGADREEPRGYNVPWGWSCHLRTWLTPLWRTFDGKNGNVSSVIIASQNDGLVSTKTLASSSSQRSRLWLLDCQLARSTTQQFTFQLGVFRFTRWIVGCMCHTGSLDIRCNASGDARYVFVTLPAFLIERNM